MDFYRLAETMGSVYIQSLNIHTDSDGLLFGPLCKLQLQPFRFFCVSFFAQ